MKYATERRLYVKVLVPNWLNCRIEQSDVVRGRIGKYMQEGQKYPAKFRYRHSGVYNWYDFYAGRDVEFQPNGAGTTGLCPNKRFQVSDICRRFCKWKRTSSQGMRYMRWSPVSRWLNRKTLETAT